MTASHTLCPDAAPRGRARAQPDHIDMTPASHARAGGEVV